MLQGVTRIVDKMLRNNYNLGYIQLALPKARIIHAVRHPLDVALSCFAQPFEGRGLPWASNLSGVCRLWRLSLRFRRNTSFVGLIGVGSGHRAA